MQKRFSSSFLGQHELSLTLLAGTGSLSSDGSQGFPAESQPHSLGTALWHCCHAGLFSPCPCVQRALQTRALHSRLSHTGCCSVVHSGASSSALGWQCLWARQDRGRSQEQGAGKALPGSLNQRGQQGKLGVKVDV